MKKRFSKKLLLNKNTVANLDFKALENVRAGEAAPDTIPDPTISVFVTCYVGCTNNCCTENTSVYPGNCC